MNGEWQADDTGSGLELGGDKYSDALLKVLNADGRLLGDHVPGKRHHESGTPEAREDVHAGKKNGATYLRCRAVVALEAMNLTFSSAAECEPMAPSCTKMYLPSLRKRRI
jgi:hypothetical protein